MAHFESRFAAWPSSTGLELGLEIDLEIERLANSIVILMVQLRRGVRVTVMRVDGDGDSLMKAPPR